MSGPSIRMLHQLKPGESAVFFALLAERSHGTTRDQREYYLCRFRDSHRTASVMVWPEQDWFGRCRDLWRAGTYFKLQAGYREHPQYGPQLEIQKVRPVREGDEADGFDESLLSVRSRFPSAEMFARLLDLAATLEHAPARELVLHLLRENRESLLALPASPRHYYPYPGGWLEHVLNVTQTCEVLVQKYAQHHDYLQTPLNVDLVLAGAMLHEIGRVQELDGGVPGVAAEQTVPGKLFGHVHLGRDMVREAARKFPDLDPQFLMLLEHLILSHLTLPEWGSPRLPMIPEVLIVHHADDLDAKLEMYARRLNDDTSEGPFTERDPILGKQLFKDRQV